MTQEDQETITISMGFLEEEDAEFRGLEYFKWSTSVPALCPGGPHYTFEGYLQYKYLQK